MRYRPILPAALLPAALLLTGQAPAPTTPPPSLPAPSEIVAAAPTKDWRPIAAGDLLVMTLAPGTHGAARRIVIQLMPPPFSQGWVRNIRKLAAAHWWDGTSVNRVQDNYVAQWGDATEKKPLPAGLETMREADYVASIPGSALEAARTRLPRRMVGADAYSTFTTFRAGWPIAMEGISDVPVVDARTGRSIPRSDYAAWPVHCYAMVGVGRNLSPDTGSGAELYTVIGQAPRHLDRNIALVGRVIEGVEHLSSLPRGTEALGFYKTEAERTPIVSIRLATELPAAEQPKFEYLSTESDTFARYVEARANRRDAFFIRPAGGVDICNAPVPMRRVTAQ